MAYTPPPYNAADASWAGSAPYTPPAANAADISFVEEVGRASGFVATKFGSVVSTAWNAVQPYSVTTAFGTADAVRSYTPLGFVATKFGEASGRFDQRGEAAGVQATVFGAAWGMFNQVGQAAGWRASQLGRPVLYPMFADSLGRVTQFGTPDAGQFWRAAYYTPTTRFGIPSTPTDRTLQAHGAARTVFGRPVAIAGTPAPSRTGTARGWQASRFGQARAVPDQVGQATAWHAPMFGLPVSTVQGQALGWVATAWGRPSTAMLGTATGWRATQAGQHAATGWHLVRPYRPRTAFGRPVGVDPWGHRQLASAPRSRFGRPRAWTAFGHQAAGGSVVTFGVSQLVQGHLVVSAGRRTHFGMPTLQRDNQC
ncbi:hypothetical protein INR38_09160 [Delftia sp. SD018]|uniref:hypothetical protein n=1 Tax=Delftia sp. SD018 TaxID=2781389 RepID=UPI001A968629|nr:hypothetical protein [Delftia sp. SD018]MBO1034254.1 hypothetical protein [Delftia sp. SD018]